MSNEVCYKCGRSAQFQLKNGEWCCSQTINSCPGKKKRNQNGVNNSRYGKKPWNYGLTKETDDRVLKYSIDCSETKIHMYKEGEMTPWNKGLTKETDKRVEIGSKKMAEAKRGRPLLKNRKPISQSKYKRKSYFRNQFKRYLYISWILPVMKRDNFKCILCGEHQELEVHHLKPYRDVFDECVKELDFDENEWLVWGQEQIEALLLKITEKHIIEIGITVCKECHGKIDPHREKFCQKKRDINETE